MKIPAAFIVLIFCNVLCLHGESAAISEPTKIGNASLPNSLLAEEKSNESLHSPSLSNRVPKDPIPSNVTNTVIASKIVDGTTSPIYTPVNNSSNITTAPPDPKTTIPTPPTPHPDPKTTVPPTPPTPQPDPNTTIPTPTTKPTTPAPTTKPTPTPTTKPTTPTSTTPSTTSSSSTTAAPSPSPTPTPSPSTTSAPTTPAPPNRNRFDGPSFIGGIVLSLGLVAIGFIGWKYYKARTERNYRTL